MGWRFAYVAMAVATAVFVLPCTLFLIRFKPEDKGLLPYGADEANGSTEPALNAETEAAPTEGVASKVALKSVPFWILFIACGLFSVLSGYSQALPAYAATAGLTSIVGLIATMCMIGSFIGMLGLGVVSDKFGGMVTGVLGTGVVLAGFLLLIFCGQAVPVALAGGLFYGLALSLINVVVPILCRDAFGSKDFAKLYSTLMVSVTALGAFGLVINTAIIDATGSYTPAFWLGVALCVVVIASIFISLKMAKRLPREA